MTERWTAESGADGDRHGYDSPRHVESVAPAVRPEPLPAWARSERRPADPRRELYEFQARLMAITPRVFVTHVLVGLNVAVLVWMVAGGVSLMHPTADQLLAHGANYGPETTAGDWWRLATSMFLHVGVIHLLVNMWALWNLGPILERFAGNAGFAIVYGLSGISGSLASITFNPDVVSAGASGAIFGLLGALVGFVLPRRDCVPGRVFWGMLYSGAVCIAINVVIGWSLPFIDNAAHFGGLGTGFLGGLVLSRRLDPAAARGRWRRNLLLALLGGTAAVVIAAEQAETNLFDAILALRDEYREVWQQYERDELTGAELADALENDLLPPWQAARQRLAVRMQAGNFTPDELRLLASLSMGMHFYETGWQQLAAALRARDEPGIERALRTIRSGDALL